MRPLHAAALLTIPLPLASQDPGDAAKTKATTLPPAAYSVAAAFDDRRAVLVRFGGFAPPGGHLGETWEWDGTSWQQIAAAGPSARGGAAMAYDDSRQVVVLFGGDDRKGPKGDTWEWDGKTWRELKVAGPSARTLAGFAFHAPRKTAVLVGGTAGDDVLDDTWEWNGAKWTQAAAGAPPRFMHGLASDRARAQLVLFGGAAAMTTGKPPVALGETWLWNGKWSQSPAKGPSARDHVAMTYDAARQCVVLYGGAAAEEPAADAWQWDGKQWRRVGDTCAPGARALPILVYDSKRRAVLLHGGFAQSPQNDLWAFDGANWRALAPASSSPKK